jgi:4-carboxymuconolactone decarboxylase
MQPEETLYDRGLATMRKMFGPGIDSAMKSLEATSPGLAGCLVEFPFADVYSRPGLDLKTRGDAHRGGAHSPGLSAG